MGHHHHGDHSHDHPHTHDHLHEQVDSSHVFDMSIPDSELSPGEVSRRGLLRGVGLLGAGAVAAGALAAPGAADAHDIAPLGRSWHHGRNNGYRWLAGDHHIHTQYSSDGMYRVIDHVDTRNFVRPQWQDGRLVLVATPAADGRIAPFEVPNPTPCCSDHH